MRADCYRLEKVFRDGVVSKGYTGSYLIKDLGGRCYIDCDTFGYCVKAPTVFRTGSGKATVGFVMTARGRILNRTYDLRKSADAAVFAVVEGERMNGWRITNAFGRPMMRIMNSDRWKNTFSIRGSRSAPKRYTVVSHASPIASIRRRAAPGMASSSGSRRIKLLASARDWMLAFDSGAAADVDHRPLWAVLVLLGADASRHPDATS
jgi:hypothetical protein